MVITRLAGTTLALMIGGVALVGTGDALAFGAVAPKGSISDRVERSYTSSLLRVASTSGSAQVSSAEVEDAVTGVWRGDWTNDVSGGAGTLVIEVNDAVGGVLSGLGKAQGGKCARDFSMTGWYRGSLAELKLELPPVGDTCPAATVTISIRMGRKNGQTIGVGHWGTLIDGSAAGRSFGVLELTKQ